MTKLQEIESRLEDVHSSLAYWQGMDEPEPECVTTAYEHLDAALEMLRARIAVEISRDDALVIVDMEDICHGEGIGPDSSDLLRRIMLAFGEDIVPKYLRPSPKAGGSQ